MRKQLIVILMLLFGATTLFGGCSSAAEANSSQPTNLTGTWIGETDGAVFTATVLDDHIKLEMKLRDTTGLYWDGTFKSTVNGPTDIKSKANTEVLKASMFGSLDSEKTFKYADESIQFTFGIAGTTQDIKMQKKVG